MKFDATRQVSKVVTVPAPVKGINAYDAISAMPDGYALVLQNMFAQPYGVQVRHGYVVHEAVAGSVTKTLCSHNTSTGSKLYAFSVLNDVRYMNDVTAPNIPSIAKLTGLVSARWQHVNFPNISGVNLICVSGQEDPIWVKNDGTIVRITDGDGTGNTIGGIDPAKFIHVYSHQKRLWFVEKDTTSGWYLPPDQLTGIAEEFDFGPQWTRGGYLNQIITWTIDDGNGADDHLVAFSSEGEASIYAGTDPDSIDQWALQGVYYIGPPVGRRAACRYGGDIAILTQQGLVTLSSFLKSTSVNPGEDFSGKYIQQLVSQASQSYGKLFGWQPFVFPDANMVLLNIPSGDVTAFQFVMNDITKAWSEFIGYNAQCWELHDSKPFFGGFGGVFRAWEQYTDGAIVADNGDVTAGVEISAEAQTVFSVFGDPVVNKHYKMVRPSILSEGTFSLAVAANVNFSFASPRSQVTNVSRESGVWDEDFWDDAVWSGGSRAYHNWTSVQGLGFTVSLRILTVSDSETLWASTDWLYEVGGVL